MQEDTLFAIMTLIYFIVPIIILKVNYFVTVMNICVLFVVTAFCIYFFSSQPMVLMSTSLILHFAFVLVLYMQTRDSIITLVYSITINIILNLSWYCSFGLLLSMEGQSNIAFPYGVLTGREVIVGYLLQLIFVIIQSALMKNYLENNDKESLKRLIIHYTAVRNMIFCVPLLIEIATMFIFLVPRVHYLYSVIVTLIMVFLFIYFLGIIALKIKFNQQRELLTIISTQHENLENRNAHLNGLKHDFKNMIISINLFVQQRDYSGLAGYIRDIDTMIDYNVETGIELPEIKNLAIKGMFLAKLMQAETMGITVHVRVIEAIIDVKVNTVKCIRVLGIVLDNAIEAAQESEEKTIDILIYRKQGQLIFLIVNSVSRDADVDMEALYSPSYSSKGADRGYGLYNINKIVKSEKRLKFKPVLNDGKFIVEFIIQEHDKEVKSREEIICD
ncbi:GHKL domain-containing protein [Listeria grandensis]|uniref:GHKL domain-containing protein n=1 Tax=Listeria grandensis TaxID=1494963 RepID=A0A7X0Y2J1_9LIST|nr:GHKL domain-containing protein [Listeria grandensis]MBC1935847.1 GHKL domain-containing protein [Listeria grandensis]